jgi:hypothetical protein
MIAIGEIPLSEIQQTTETGQAVSAQNRKKTRLPPPGGPSDNPHYAIIRSKKAVPGINPSHGFRISEFYIMPTDYRTARQAPRPPAPQRQLRNKI